MSKQIGEVVKRLLHRFESNRSLQKQKAREAWKETVSPEIFDQTVMLGYRDGNLKIGVESQPLLSQMENFQKQQIERDLVENGLSSLEKVTFRPV